MVYVYIVAEIRGCFSSDVQASHFGGFCCFGGWAPGMCTSVAVAATWAQLLYEGWVLAGPGIKPRFPVLAWSFHTVETAAAPSSRGRESACLPGQARRPPSVWLLHKVPDFRG